MVLLRVDMQPLLMSNSCILFQFVGHLSKLVSFDCSNNDIYEIAEEMCKCIHLADINFTYNNINVRFYTNFTLSSLRWKGRVFSDWLIWVSSQFSGRLFFWALRFSQKNNECGELTRSDCSNDFFLFPSLLRQGEAFNTFSPKVEKA